MNLKKMMVILAVSASSALTLNTSFAASKMGGDSGGGGQGAMDIHGNFHYLDILSKNEIDSIEFSPASDSNIISKIRYTKQLHQDVEGSKFEAEFNEAKKLLKAAGLALIPKNVKYVVDGGTYLKDIPLSDTTAFKITAFPLPQIADATQVNSDLQIQIAFFRHGFVYIQEQALLLLKNKARGIFIKETLRRINENQGFNLPNSDLEQATYFIFHGQIDDFKQTNFAKTYISNDPLDLSTWKTERMFKMNYGTWDSQYLTLLPETFSFVETGELEVNNYRFNPKAPEGMSWSTETGKLTKN